MEQTGGGRFPLVEDFNGLGRRAENHLHTFLPEIFCGLFGEVKNTLVAVADHDGSETIFVTVFRLVFGKGVGAAIDLLGEFFSCVSRFRRWSE